MNREKIYTVINIIILVIVLSPLLYIFSTIINYLISSFYTENNLLFDQRILGLVLRSIFLSTLVVIFTTIIALPLAQIFVKYRFTLSKIFLIAIMIILLIPPYIYGISWIYILGDQGWLNVWIMKIFSLGKPVFSIYGFGGTVFVETVWLFPLSFLFFLNALKINKSLNETAGLYQSGFRKFVLFNLPLAKPGIISGMIFTFILSITNFSVPGVLRLNVFPTEIFTQFGAFFNHSQAFFLSTPFLIIAILLLFYFSKLNREGKSFQIKNDIPGNRMPTRTQSILIYSILILILSVSLVLPIITLVKNTESFKYFIDAIELSWNQILNSLFFAVTGSLLLTVIGFNFAYYVRNLAVSKQRVIDILVFLPFIIPGTIYGISLIQIYNSSFFGNIIYGAYPIVILSYLKFLPVSYFVCKIAFIKIPKKYEEAAKITGNTTSIVLRKIILPLSKPHIILSVFLTFILCIGEVDSSILINPPGFETLSTQIFSLLHYGANEMVAALTIIQISFVMLFVIIGWKLAGVGW